MESDSLFTLDGAIRVFAALIPPGLAIACYYFLVLNGDKFFSVPPKKERKTSINLNNA